MNVDYKILNKMPENRIQMCTKGIIYHNQVELIPEFKFDVAYVSQCTTEQ